MNPHIVYPLASAAIKKINQEHPPVAGVGFLLRRCAQTSFALVLCQLLAMLGVTAPASAQTLTGAIPKNGIVTVKWTGGTAPYQLETSTDLVNWQEVDVATSGTTVQSIQTSPKAFYRVRGPGGGGGGSTDRKAPTVPTGVTATANSCSQITVSWTASTDGNSGVASYKVYRDGVFLVTVSAPTTRTSDVGLAASTIHSYAVLAVDVAGNASAKSASVSATTPVCIDSTPPSVPVVIVAPVNCSQINISWTASTDNFGGSGLQGYSVYRNNAFLKQVLAPATSTSDTGLPGSTTYSYAVMAIDKAGNQSAMSVATPGSTSACGDTTPPSVPTGLTVTAASCSQINLSWTASTDTGGSGLSGYYIYRNNAYFKTVVGATSTSDTGLAASTAYSYSVLAVDNTGNQSAQCAAVSANTLACPDTTAPSVPAGLTATAASTSQINLSWSPSLDNPGGTGVAGYYIYRNGVQVGSSATTSYSSTGLASGTQYCFSVTAYDNSGNQSALSTQACATTQTSCTYALSSSSASVLAAGGSSSITVTAGSSCTWTPIGNAAWLTCTPATGTGTGSLTWTAVANTTTASRTGTITIFGQVFTVTQAGATCTYSLSSSSASIIAGGGSGSVNVTAGTGCAWTASSSATAWLNITAGSSGNGPGTVSYSAAANTATTSRSGTLTIAGQVFTVSQAAAACTFTLSSTGISIGSIATVGSVNVTAGSGCGWIASSSASWLTITAGFSGNGNGSVTYSAIANLLTTSRSGTMTIAGQTFTVTQAAALGDTTPPTVSLTSPTGGTTVSNMMTLTANASDTGGSGIARVEFYCDSTVLLGTATTTPYSLSSDTKSMANGNHTLYSKAFDGGGNSASSATISVTVNNAAQSTATWAKRFGGTSDDNGTAVAVDGSGNSVVAGYFMGSIDLGGGILIGSGGWDIFLAKFSATGALLWSKRFGGPGNELVNSVALDASGNIFLGGYFTGTGNFGGADHVSVGSSADAFLAKYDSQGNPLWDVTFGDTYSDSINGIATDSQGNIVATGYYQGSVPLIDSTRPSSGVDAFLAKFSPAGTKIWAMRFANAGGRECGTGVAVDKRVNPATGAPYDAIFLTGFFGGYITFGGTTLMDAGGFLAKFSPDGTNLWSRGSGSNNASPGPIAVDSNGDVAISGAFAVQTDVGGGAIIGTGVFIAKYSGSVGSYLWASVIGGTVNGRSMTADAHNNIILAGNFSGTCNFGGQSLTSMYYGGFLAKYSGTGTPIWVVNMIGSTDESLNAVAVDASGYPIVTGGFAGTASLAGQSLTSAGSTDIVLGRVNQ